MQRIITALTMPDKRKQAFLIELNGQPWHEIDVEVVVKMHLATGMELTPEMQSRIDKENEFVLARRRAVNFCVKMPRTRRQVERLLGRKHIKEETIERVVLELARQELLRDWEVVQRGVRRAERLKIGPRRAKAELNNAGVDDDLINEQIGPIRDPEWQRKEAAKLAQRRLERLKDDVPADRNRKTAQYLLRRGFDPEIVQDVLREAGLQGEE